MVGVVQDVDIAAAHRPLGVPVAADYHLDRLAHGAEVHRHVRGVGDQAAFGVEDRAREVEPLLDVDRVRGGLQPHPHLLGDRHEQVVEDLEHHRIGAGADARPGGPRRYTRQQQVAAVAHDGPPARLDHGGGEVLGDDGRAVDGVPRPQPGPREQVHLRPGPAGEHRDPRQVRGPLGLGRVFPGRTRRAVSIAAGFLPGFLRGPGDLHGNGFHDDRLVAHEEGEAAGVFGLERSDHLLQRADRDDDGGVGALVAQVGPVRGGNPAGGTSLPALGLDLGARVEFQRAQDLRQPVEQAGRERRLDGLLAHRDNVGQPDPVRGQHAGQRVDEHAGHAERVGDGAGMLAAGPAEHVEDVLGDVVAALHRDLLDRVGHVSHGDLDEAGGHLLGTAGVARGLGDLLAEVAEQRFRRLGVERLIAVLAEHPGKVVRLDAAEQHVGVGDGKRAAAPVTGRPGIRARRVGPGPVPAAVEVQHRAAARRHGVDGQHRRPHPHPGDLRLVLALELAREMRHVGGRAAHVEADDLAEAGPGGRAGHADDAAGRARQDGVLAAEAGRIGQAAVGLHEQQPDAGQFAGHLGHVAAQDGREVGVDHRGVAPGDQLHQRTGLV